MNIKPFGKLCRYMALPVLAIVAALGLPSCDTGADAAESFKARAEEYELQARKLNLDFYDQLRSMKDSRCALLPEYEAYRTEVQNKSNEFLTKLAKCTEQADADELFAKYQGLADRNDSQKQQIDQAIDDSPAAQKLKGFDGRRQSTNAIKRDVRSDMDDFAEMYGADAQEELVAETNALLKQGDERMSGVSRSVDSLKGMLAAQHDEAAKIHDDVVSIVEGMNNSYRGWVPPPPAPFRPEKVLFTLETTPALLEKLVSTLVQQYKQYTLRYDASDGVVCITDAHNKEGVVIRLVKPDDMGTALASLSQGRCDVVVGFRRNMPEDTYAKLEEQDSAHRSAGSEPTLYYGIAYNALLVKVSRSAELEKINNVTLGKSLTGYTVCIEPGDSLAADMLDRKHWEDAGIQFSEQDRPEKCASSDAKVVALIPYTSQPTSTKEISVAWRAEDDVPYFWPTPGNIVSGRYCYYAPVVAILNPDSPANAAARDFVAFVDSQSGQQIVTAADFISRNQYDADDEEIRELKKMFEKKGYAVGRIIAHDTFLFPKNDTRISKQPVMKNKAQEFAEFDSSVRSNFDHLINVARATQPSKGQLALGVIGHASSEGGERVNQPLSVNRAKYTSSCVKDGVPKLLSVEGGVSSRIPVDTNKTEEGRVRNRRTSAYIVEVFEVESK